VERTRELDVDVAWVVGSLPFGAFAYTLDGIAVEDDAFLFAVELRPYVIEHVVQTHYAILSVTGHETSGRVLYVNPERPPIPMRRAQRIVVADQEREVVRRRVAQRQESYARMCLVSEQALRRAQLERRLLHLRGKDGAIAVSLESGELEVLPVVPDPFPSPPACVLVIDADATVAAPLAAAREITVICAADIWSALDAIHREGIDLVICALRVGDVRAAELFRMVIRIRPDLGARFVFLANAHEVEGAPSSVRERTLERPLDVAAVRTIIARNAAWWADTLN
jgi:hypothetical protein